MKNFTKIALLMLLVLASVFMMVACNDGDGEGSSGTLTVKEGAMPQLTHVQGEELDLSNGTLVLTTEAGTEEVTMNAEGVTVSGYDKSKLGEQTVTVSYKGCTAQLTVTVVERMKAEDAVSAYLVGDSFDMSKGRLKITRNDGTTFTAIFNSDKVTVTGFDGSKTGEQTLTATYKNGSTTYTCQFNVTVYAVDSVSLTAPTKTKYNSHDAALNLKGGELVLKGNNNTLERKILLTDLAATDVTGFDPSVVSAANKTKDQTITVHYNGGEYTFEVQLTYTDISSFKDSAKPFVGLNFTDPDLEFTDEMGNLALELIQLYMSFNPSEQEFISEEEWLSVARAAFMYGLTAIQKEEKAMSGAFVVEYDEYAQMYVPVLVSKSTREAVAAALLRLQKTDNVLYTITPILKEMQKEFANEILLEGETSNVYFKNASLVEEKAYEKVRDVLAHMIAVADLSAAIPENWKELGIDHYATAISNLYTLIYANAPEMEGWPEAYYYVSAWRKNDDMFDLMYEYYYSERNNSSLAFLAGICFPTGLEDIIAYIGGMMEQADAYTSGYSYDATWVLYYYHMALDAFEKVKNGDNAMLKYLLENLPVNTMLGMNGGDNPDDYIYTEDMMEYLRSSSTGYYAFCGGLLGDPTFKAFMDVYMDILSKLALDDEAGTYEKGEAYSQDMKALLNAYAAFTPAQHINLLTIFNTFYGNPEFPVMAFNAIVEFEGENGEPGEVVDLTCVMVELMNTYFDMHFTSEEAKEAYQNLMLVTELYAQRSIYANWHEEVTKMLASVKTAYGAMNEADKAVFESMLKGIYDQYNGYMTVYNEGNAITTPEDLKAALGEWEDDFIALQEALFYAEIAYNQMAEDQNYLCYGLFLTAYERAADIYNRLMQKGTDAVREMLVHYDIYSKLDVDEFDKEYIYTSFEHQVSIYRGIYTNFLMTAIGGSIYDQYVGTDLQVFMNMVYDLLGKNPAKEKVLAIMSFFRTELTLDEQALYIMLEGDYLLYEDAITAFLTQIVPDPDGEGEGTPLYTDKAATVAYTLLLMEKYVVLYQYYEQIGEDYYLPVIAEFIDGMMNGIEADNPEEAFDGLNAIYASFDEADEASFADFADMYEYYVEICEEIIATLTPAQA